ncbi:OmpA family protein [Psychromonas aquimarina]|uniref:OmpA family protein n=1 Tax=Psychromonas aquimarina TaxID=444919 RepID=UPI0004038B21|nr:OmpA family protein [Psychromonas aquimarina]
MRVLVSIFAALFVSACSVQVVEMSPEPTAQVFDLKDIEGDGVINARDECPDTFSGAQVNNSGCGAELVEKVRRKLLVNFATNSYIVAPEFFPEIEALADFMNNYPSTNVTIEGHTSIRGSRKLNMKLSQNRAQAIKDILVSKFAIDEDRVEAVGYGFDRLLLEGNDDYIHARNRRIVAEISSEKSMKDMKWTIYSVDQLAE